MKMWRIAPEVQSALDASRPVVALETAITTHGLPSPINIQLADEVAERVRSNGAIPATIALLDGQIVVGMTPAEINQLVCSPNTKATTADIPRLVAKEQSASTTVAATMALAHRAGIRVIATGGIGGVHRGAATTDDVSADLCELARTPSAVVCSGAKIILDLPRTLERLESLGVLVVGYRCDEFPGFYIRNTGLPLSSSAETPGEIAKIMRVAESLNLESGIVVAQPPSEAAELKMADLEQQIETALLRAQQKGITGKQVTPFLLKSIQESSEHRALETNCQILLSNAQLAAEIATEYANH